MKNVNRKSQAQQLQQQQQQLQQQQQYQQNQHQQQNQKKRLKLNSHNELDNEENNLLLQFISNLQPYQKYYIEIFPYLIKSLNRPWIISYILLIISQFQEAALMISRSDFSTGNNGSDNTNTNDAAYNIENNNDNDNNKNYDSSTQLLFYLNKTIGKDLLNGVMDVQSGIQLIMIVCFIINMIMILLVIITLLFYTFNLFEKKIIMNLAYICSIFSSVYNYIIFTPSLDLSLLIIYHSNIYPNTIFVAYLNVPLTLIIGLSINYHDQDYTFIGHDYLARRESKLDIMRQLFLAIITLLNVSLNEKVLVIIILLYSIVKLGLYYKEQFFLRKYISCMYLMTCCAFCSFAMLMSINYIVQEIQNLGVLLLLQIGLSTRLGYDIYMRYQQNLFSLCMGKTDLNFLPTYQVDIFVRQLNQNLSFFYEDYIEKGQAMIFETIFINHKLNCDIQDYNCFCYEFKRDDDGFNLEEYIGQEYRKRFVFQYIASIYEKFAQSQQNLSHNNFTMLSYISYLFEIMNISTRSYTVIYNYQSRMFSRSAGLSLKGIQSLHMIFGRLNKQFEHFFNNPKLQNQRIQMIQVINFDEHLISFKSITRQYLIHLGEYYDSLCSNFISLQDLQRRSSIQLKEYEETQRYMNWLYDVNPDDKQLQYITAIYSHVFDFQDRKVFHFIARSKRTTLKFIKPNERNYLNIFLKNSCILYASLNQPGGVIKKVSKQFSSVFEFENMHIINKSINQLVPRGIYDHHDDFVHNFKIKGTMSIINQGERTVFGINSRGFIFPIKIRLKLENILGELGVCSLITKIPEYNHFIFLDQKQQISDVTEDLFHTVFKHIFTKNELQHQNIYSLIPITLIIKELKEYDLNFSTILLIPKNRTVKSHKEVQTTISIQNLDSLKNIENNLQLVQDNFLFFTIELSLRSLQTAIGRKYEYLEIFTFQKVYSFEDKKLCLEKLKESFKAFNEYDKATANGNTLSNINNMIFDQMKKLQGTSYTKSNNNKNYEDGQTDHSDSFFKSEEAISEDISIKKKQNYMKRLHSQEKDLIQFSNVLAATSQNYQNISPVAQFNQMSFHEKYDDSLPAYRHFNLELNKIQNPLFDEFQSQEGQILFSPKEMSNRLLLTPKGNEVIEEIVLQDNNNIIINNNLNDLQISRQQSDKKQFSFLSNEIIKSKNADNELQTASRSNKNQSQQRKPKSQKSSRKNNRKKTTKIMQKYEQQQRNLDDSYSNQGFSQEQDGKNDHERGDIQSLRSSNISMNEQKKKQIINSIQSQGDSFVVKMFILVVMMSFIILLMVSIVQYQELSRSIEVYRLDFEQLNIFNQFNDFALRIQSQKSFLDLFKENNILIQSSKDIPALMEEIKRSNEDFIDQKYHFQERYLRTLNSNSFQEYYDVFLKNTTFLNLTNVEQVDVKQDIREVTIIYELLIYQQKINEVLYEHQLQDQNDIIATRLDFFWDNYYPIFKTTYQVQGVIENQVKSEFEYIETLELVNLIVLLIVVGVLIFSIIPMNIIGQIQIEKMLKLFGSFQPDKLQKYTDLIEYCVVKIDEMAFMNQFYGRQFEDILKSHVNNILCQFDLQDDSEQRTVNNIDNSQRIKSQAKIILSQTIQAGMSNAQNPMNSDRINIIRRLPNRRMRSIASFNSLPKINLFIIIGSLIAIGLLMIYPIVSLLIMNNYQSEGRLVISERIALFDACSLIIDYQANHQGYWLFHSRKLNNPNLNIDYRLDEIYENIKSLHEQGDTYLQRASDIVLNQNLRRKNQKKYKEVFLGILNNNICDVYKNYPEYFFIKNLTPTQCGEKVNGIMLRGYIITMQEISQYFKQYLQLYQSLEGSATYSQDLFSAVLNQQSQKSGVSQYNELIRVFKNVTIALDNYIYDSQNDYYHYIMNINMNLFVMQIIIIFLTFFFGWSFFYKKFVQSLQSTRTLFYLFHIQLILDNPIFVSFFQNRKRNNFN